MNRDDVIRMAREAGLDLDESGDLGEGQIWFFEQKDLDRFANLIASHVAEECAKVCDNLESSYRKEWKSHYNPHDQGMESGAFECSDSIRSLYKPTAYGLSLWY